MKRNPVNSFMENLRNGGPRRADVLQKECREEVVHRYWWESPDELSCLLRRVAISLMDDFHLRVPLDTLSLFKGTGRCVRVETEFDIPAGDFGSIVYTAPRDSLIIFDSVGFRAPIPLGIVAQVQVESRKGMSGGGTTEEQSFQTIQVTGDIRNGTGSNFIECVQLFDQETLEYRLTNTSGVLPADFGWQASIRVLDTFQVSTP